MTGDIDETDSSAGLDTDLNVLAVPGLEGLQELQAGAVGINVNIHLARGRRLVGLFTCNSHPWISLTSSLKARFGRMMPKRKTVQCWRYKQAALIDASRTW